MTKLVSLFVVIRNTVVFVPPPTAITPSPFPVVQLGTLFLYLYDNSPKL